MKKIFFLFSPFLFCSWDAKLSFSGSITKLKNLCLWKSFIFELVLLVMTRFSFGLSFRMAPKAELDILLNFTSSSQSIIYYSNNDYLNPIYILIICSFNTTFVVKPSNNLCSLRTSAFVTHIQRFRHFKLLFCSISVSSDFLKFSTYSST